MLSPDFQAFSEQEATRNPEDCHFKPMKEDYKHSPTGSFIPRERFLKQQLSFFLSTILKEKQIAIEPYQGIEPELQYEDGSQSETESESDDENEEIEYKLAPLPQPIISNPRHSIHLAVHELSYFESQGPIPDMDNGHIYNKNDSKILRCLVMKNKMNDIIGAIYFKIHLKRQCCEVRIVEIDPSHRSIHLGATLLHAAIFVGLMYNCHLIELMSTTESIGFYISQGFFLDPNKYELENDDIYLNQPKEIIQKYGRLPYLLLNVLDPKHLHILEKKMRLTSSGFNLLNTLLASRKIILELQLEHNASDPHINATPEVIFHGPSMQHEDSPERKVIKKENTLFPSRHHRI